MATSTSMASARRRSWSATLRELGADCDWLIPDRMADGYGLSAANVERLAERGTALISPSTAASPPSRRSRSPDRSGMEVIVTDHHQPGPSCPTARSCTRHSTAIRSPTSAARRWPGSSPGRRRGGPREILRRRPAGPRADAISTWSPWRLLPTSCPCRREPVARQARAGGGRAGAAARDPGASRGCDTASRRSSTRATWPSDSRRRINAAGRLYRADAGVELFLTDDEARAAEIATELNRANGERRATEREVDDRGGSGAAGAAGASCGSRRRWSLAGQGWHPGVIGIVASRLVEQHHRPTVVISLDGEGGGRGSGRSIPGFDLLAGFEACAEHLVGFGGHRAAAGLELAARRTSTRSARPLPRTRPRCSRPRTCGAPSGSTRWSAAPALGLDLAEELGRLAPVRHGQPRVRLLVPSARVRDVRSDGRGQALPLQPPQRLPPGAGRRLWPLQPRSRRGRAGRRRGAAGGQPLERLGRAAGGAARALPGAVADGDHFDACDCSDR